MLSETEIGDYEIIKGGVLGTGAFATVWKGRHRKDHSNLVAIKAIKKKNFLKSQQLLSKEITILKSLSGLQHKNVVGLLDCVELKDDVCLVMEYCNGGDLADCLHRNGTLSEDTLCSYVKQIGGAMKALQQKGIVHRDLKPQNILLCYEGPKYPHPSEMLLKIADFGFARFIMGGEMATTLCGSPMYMAPEVIMSVKYSAKADLWSIGTILYQCLTGRAPFQAQNPQELKKKYEKSPGLKPNIPTSTSPELRDLLMRMLKRDAEERISFEEFFSHPFLQLATTVKISSQPVSVPKRRSSSSSDSSTPGKSPSPSHGSKATSGGASAKTASPSRSAKIAETKEEEMVTTLTETAGFTKIEKDEVKGRSGRSTPDDYVMVPENLCMESEEESVCIRRAPLAEEEMASFSVSPHRSPKANRQQPVSSAQPTATNITTLTKATPSLAPVPTSHQQRTPVTANPRTPSSSSSSPLKSVKTPPLSSTTDTTASPRPVTLPMSTTPRQSDPISVPADMKQGGSIEGVTLRPKVKSPDVRMESDHQDRTVATRQSENRLSRADAVDAGSFSPPAVQFCVGTPPNSGSGPSWRRSSVGMVTPPPYTSNLVGSPHRKAFMIQSPNKMPVMFPLGFSSSTSSNTAVSPRHDNSPTAHESPYGSARLGGGGCCGCYHTVPDNMVALAAGGHLDALQEMPTAMDYHRASTDSNLYAHDILNQNRQGTMVPYAYRRGRERTMSSCSDAGTNTVTPGTTPTPSSIQTGTTPPLNNSPIHRTYGSAMDIHHCPHHHPYHHQHHSNYHHMHHCAAASANERCAQPSSPLARRSNCNASPPCQQHLMTQSPPQNTSGGILHTFGMGSTASSTSGTSFTTPLRFLPQPLSEETLMDDNHNEILGKLSYILDLVECILDLAQTLGSALRPIDPSESRRLENLSPEQHIQYRSCQRNLEQLVLYARACHLLHSSLHLARDEIRNDRLQHSTTLRRVLGDMNSSYHHVVDRCKVIHKEFTSSCKTPLTQKLVMATADKLIYNEAIQMCQAAALDEFSNRSPENMAEVVRRYRVAQVFLHSLAQTARNENDKHMLLKYLKSVESRLTLHVSPENIRFNRHRQQQQYQFGQQQSQPVDNQLYHQHNLQL